MDGPIPASEMGSRHAGEIEYVFQTLKSVDVPWTEGDFQVSDAMSSYWTNFAKTGDPNANGLPKWPQYNAKDDFQVMHLSSTNMKATAEPNRHRYVFLDGYAPKAK